MEDIKEVEVSDIELVKGLDLKEEVAGDEDENCDGNLGSTIKIEYQKALP